MYKCFILLCAFLAIACFSHADGWVPLNPIGNPPAVFGHTLVQLDGQFFLFGGQAEGRSIMLNELHRFSPSENKWTKETPNGTALPEGRQGHTAVVYDQKMYIFAGQGKNGDLNDVWAYNPQDKTWESQVSSSPEVPAGRYAHSSVVVGDKAYICGGKASNSNLGMDDVWAYDFAKKAWAKESTVVSGAIYGQSMSAFTNRLYIYGGQYESGVTNITWYYDLSTKEWNYVGPQGKTEADPVARRYAVTVQDAQNFFIYGGSGEEGRDLIEKKDIWQFSFATNTWTKKADGPVTKTQSAGILLPQQNGQDVNVFVFGGITQNQVVNTTMQYYSSNEPPDPPDPPQPGKKEILGQIGALGKDSIAAFFLTYDKDQEKVKIEIEWTEEKAKLQLFALHLPFMMRDENLSGISELAETESSQNFELKYLEHFEKLDIEPQEQRGRKILTYATAVKKGTLSLVVRHKFFSPSAREIKFKASEMSDLPKKMKYWFPLGDPNKKVQIQKHFIQTSVLPVRWNSVYPSFCHGKENVESSTESWKWNFEEQSRIFTLLPFAFVKIELP